MGRLRLHQNNWWNASERSTSYTCERSGLFQRFQRRLSTTCAARSVRRHICSQPAKKAPLLEAEFFMQHFVCRSCFRNCDSWGFIANQDFFVCFFFRGWLWLTKKTKQRRRIKNILSQCNHWTGKKIKDFYNYFDSRNVPIINLDCCIFFSGCFFLLTCFNRPLKKQKSPFIYLANTRGFSFLAGWQSASLGQRFFLAVNSTWDSQIPAFTRSRLQEPD